MAKPTFTVQWKRGTRFKTSAEVAHSEIERLRSLNPSMSTRELKELLVKESRSKDAPLHQDFEWDDRKAAHEHRIGTAGKIIRSIDMVRCSEPDPAPIRRYSLVKDSIGEKKKERVLRRYEGTEEALRDPNYRAQIFEQAIQDVERLRHKYKALKDLAQIFDDTREKIASKKP